MNPDYIKLPHKCGNRKGDYAFTFNYNNLRQGRKDAMVLAEQMWCESCYVAIKYIPLRKMKQIVMQIYIKDKL